MSLGLLRLTNCEHSPRREPVRVRGVELDLVTSATWQTFHGASQCVCNGLNTRCSSWILTHILIPGKFETHVQFDQFAFIFFSKCCGTFLPLVAPHFCQFVTVVWNWKTVKGLESLTEKYPNPMGMSGHPHWPHTLPGQGPTAQCGLLQRCARLQTGCEGTAYRVLVALQHVDRGKRGSREARSMDVNGAVRWGKLKVVSYEYVWMGLKLVGIGISAESSCQACGR